MVRLQSADLMALLEFVDDVGDLDFEEPYPPEVVARLPPLVRCVDAAYQECDLRAHRFTTVVGILPEEGGDEELYWSVGPCPISGYRVRTGDLAAVTMSDVVGARRYHQLPIFLEYFRPAGIDDVIDLGLSAESSRVRSFVLFRATGAPDFSQRDRAVLDLLRPHLRQLERQAALRHQLSEVLRRYGDDDAGEELSGVLTRREREIVDLVAEGRTNAQIAAALWVAPSTVKKHLEHVYAKLGVGRRTAAATLVHAGR